MTFIRYMRVWQMVNSARLSLVTIILSLLKQLFSITVAKKKKFIKGKIYGSCKIREEEKEGRDLMSKSKPVSQSSVTIQKSLSCAPIKAQDC